MMIKDGNVSIEYSDDFLKTMDSEYRYYFDTTENLFFEHPDIRVCVKEGSLLREKASIYYYQDSKLAMTFHGTVFFAKLGKRFPRSLSKKEVAFLLRNLRKDKRGRFHIKDDMEEYILNKYGEEYLKLIQ